MKKRAAQSGNDQLARQFHLELESKADTQFAHNQQFEAARLARAKARLALHKLFVQAPAATTMSPMLQPELDKTSSVELSMEQLESLGLVKRAYQIQKEKRAYPGDGSTPMSTSEPTGWLGQFKGTPLYGRARALEAAQIEHDLESNLRDQKRHAEQKDTPPDPISSAFSREGEALRLKRNELELERRLMAVKGKTKIGKELTEAAREKIPTKQFAIPEKEKYPIHDKAHARNALARVSAHGSGEEKARVRTAVARKHPDVVGEETKEDLSQMKKSASIAPRVDAWFEKNAHVFRTEAMERFPELQKVAADPKRTINVKRKVTSCPSSMGELPAQHSLSGGSA